MRRLLKLTTQRISPTFSWNGVWIFALVSYKGEGKKMFVCWYTEREVACQIPLKYMQQSIPSHIVIMFVCLLVCFKVSQSIYRKYRKMRQKKVVRFDELLPSIMYRNQGYVISTSTGGQYDHVTTIWTYLWIIKSCLKLYLEDFKKKISSTNALAWH